MAKRPLIGQTEVEERKACFDVFNIGEGQGEIHVLAGTFFIPLENDDYLEAFDICFRW